MQKMTMKSLSLYIIKHKKNVHIIAVALFIVGLIFGILWIIYPKNNVLEPSTYVIGCLFTVFISLPRLAEFIIPPRKPIREMTHDELLQFILTTDAQNDWQSIDREFIEERFLKEEPRFRIRTKTIDEGIHNDDFKEEWANRHPDPSAKSYYYNIFIDENLIDRIVLVSIDGHRALLPIPNRQTMQVLEFDYHIAKIFDDQNSLEQYMIRSRIHL